MNGIQNCFLVILSEKKILKTINSRRKSTFTEKRVDLELAQVCPSRENVFKIKFKPFYSYFKKDFLRQITAKKIIAFWKFSFFSKKLKKNFFFQFFHRINILELKGHYRVILRSHRVSWGHWRSQVVMVMTSFPNYYVINDFIDRTSFLGQMNWNSAQNDIFAKIITSIVI